MVSSRSMWPRANRLDRNRSKSKLAKMGGSPRVATANRLFLINTQRNKVMKPQQTKQLGCWALALFAGGLALSFDNALLAAEPTANPATTSTYGSGKNYKTTVERHSEGQL